MGSIELKNITRYECGRPWDEPTPFCLQQLGAFDTEDATVASKIGALLSARTDLLTSTRIETSCGIGGCTLKLVQDTKEGRKSREGECKASTYCLKTEFAGVGSGEVDYREIINDLEGHADRQSAGNFCPRLDCSLSAGVSIDMVPGTAGECVIERKTSSGQLELPV